MSKSNGTVPKAVIMEILTSSDGQRICAFLSRRSSRSGEQILQEQLERMWPLVSRAVEAAQEKNYYIPEEEWRNCLRMGLVGSTCLEEYHEPLIDVIWRAVKQHYGGI